MRLIDADSIPWDVEGVGEIPVITKEEIDQMPTVDAIPVEWIVEYKEKYSNTSSEEADVIKAETLVDMLADWAERKEE